MALSLRFFSLATPRYEPNQSAVIRTTMLCETGALGDAFKIAFFF